MAEIEIEFPPDLARRFEALACRLGKTPSALLAEVVERDLDAVECGERVSVSPVATEDRDATTS